MKNLYVFYESDLVGTLSIDEESIYSFQYHKDWIISKSAFPISLALPLQEEKFGNRLTLSFFENLLPEGDIRRQLEQGKRISGSFAFLREFGNDCAGAFSIREQRDFLASKSGLNELSYAEIDSALDNKRSIAELLATKELGYLSLAGAQDKFAAIYKSGKLYLPIGNEPSTHIVKTPIWRNTVKESVYNEFYCMKLAKIANLDVPEVQVIENRHPLFIVKRFDRKTKGEGVARIHQQDFCQAQGITSNQKYEHEGGPSLVQNFELIKKHVSVRSRIEAMNSVLRWVSFNILIGNNDSHSKNISFLIDDGVKLSPFYDLISTEIYSGLKKEFSFLIGGRNRVDKIGKSQFAILNDQLNLKKGVFEEVFINTLDKVEKEYEQLSSNVVKQFSGCKVTKRITALIAKRIKKYRKEYS